MFEIKIGGSGLAIPKTIHIGTEPVPPDKAHEKDPSKAQAKRKKKGRKEPD